jgi:hypothetical protein
LDRRRGQLALGPPAALWAFLGCGRGNAFDFLEAMSAFHALVFVQWQRATPSNEYLESEIRGMNLVVGVLAATLSALFEPALAAGVLGLRTHFQLIALNLV